MDVLAVCNGTLGKLEEMEGNRRAKDAKKWRRATDDSIKTGCEEREKRDHRTSEVLRWSNI